MGEERKTFIYVLVEDIDGATEKEKRVIEALRKFEDLHKLDAEVVFLAPSKPEEFRRARENFGVRKTPAVVLSDSPMTGSSDDPHITLERDVLEKFEANGIFELVTDLHYTVLDERVLRYKLSVAMSLLGNVFKELWPEVKDLLKVTVAVAG